MTGVLNNNWSNILLPEDLSVCMCVGGVFVCVGGANVLWNWGQMANMRIKLVLKD